MNWDIRPPGSRAQRRAGSSRAAGARPDTRGRRALSPASSRTIAKYVIAVTAEHPGGKAESDNRWSSPVQRRGMPMTTRNELSS